MIKEYRILNVIKAETNELEYKIKYSENLGSNR